LRDVLVARDGHEVLEERATARVRQAGADVAPVPGRGKVARRQRLRRERAHHVWLDRRVQCTARGRRVAARIEGGGGRRCENTQQGRVRQAECHPHLLVRGVAALARSQNRCCGWRAPALGLPSRVPTREISHRGGGSRQQQGASPDHTVQIQDNECVARNREEFQQITLFSCQRPHSITPTLRHVLVSDAC
jgi:hypothetical protein